MRVARLVVIVVLAGLAQIGTLAAAQGPDWIPAAMQELEAELVAQYGEEQQERIQRGLQQVADFWRSEDGDQAQFEGFVRTNFAGDQENLDVMFHRFEKLFEVLYGHMIEIILAFREQSDLDIGPIMPFDRVFAAYDPSAHISDDFFANKLAFTVLLNFPLTTLEQRLSEGDDWTRRQWAEARLAASFDTRIPAHVQQEVSTAGAVADEYIAEYNIWMHHLLNDQGERLFPAKMKLLTHWNLRDQIKADYTDPDGLAKQRMTQRVMERIVDQTIPEMVVNNPLLDWNPYANEVWPAAVQDSDQAVPENLDASNDPEPDTRYEVLLGTFHAMQLVDEYSPTAPTLIDRRFNQNREIPEARVEEMFEEVLSSPLLAQVGELIEKRLGRPLEPFDIWYNGFRQQGTHTQAELDAMTKERYPTPAAYQADIPRLLVDLGFEEERAKEIAANIVVDPARGSGHAWGAAMRDAKTHLRTRVGPDGMDYKGYNIAVHEMGHNVEQTVSLNEIDYYMLQGVPNTAFTEALAFVFQARDLELLGLGKPDEKARAFQILDDFWGAAEISAVALVDMRVWHWMYDHPDATAAELKEATLEISKEVWNEYFAEIFNRRDVVLLGVYSHMIHSFLYLPDYPIGHLIALQVEEQMEKAGDLGGEFERMSKMGNVTPDLWMRNATGKPVGPEALLAATGHALEKVSEASGP